MQPTTISGRFCVNPKSTKKVWLPDSANDEHPLQRLITMEKQEDGTLEITLTDPHLTRGLGEALHKAYAGDLQYHYQEDEYLLRVYWQRD